MFIKSVKLKNYRLFKDGFQLKETHLAVPDGINTGSGLTILVGENGTGKSSILDGIALPLISYRAESIQLHDFCNIQQPVEVVIKSDVAFTVKKTMSGEFSAIGFKFVAKLREQNSTRFAVGTSVSDTYFIPEDSGSVRAGSPDLRIAVQNPFAGPRFNENDYVFIDKNRIKTLESGTYSTTRFDRLLDNFNFLYLKANNNEPLQLHEAIDSLINTGDENIGNELLEQAFQYFEEITGYQVKLNFIDDTLPYKKAFLAFTSMDRAQIPIEKIGSGYQMFLALICQHKLSLQSGKKLILLIDEVELNLHPRLQRSLVDLLLEISKTTQIILSSHSPELLKDLQKNSHHKTNALVRSGDTVTINPINKFVLPLPTVSETNYVAFGLASMEYYIELYNQFGEMNSCETVAAIDRAFNLPATELIAWERENGVIQNLSKYSCIRNKFHHPNNRLNDDKFSYDYDAISGAIDYLRQRIAG
jgi:AAA15 family ATPase/GTPase